MRLKSKLKNFKCRTCLQSNRSLTSLSILAADEEPQKTYSEMLKQLTNINVMEDKCEEITQLICGKCIRKMKAAIAFIKQAQEVNAQLLTIRGQDDSGGEHMDCLNESQVYVESYLVIKMEDNEEAEVPQCDAELKIEQPDENILTNITTSDISADKLTFKKNNSNKLKPSVEKSDEDTLNISIKKENYVISDYEDNFDWNENFNSSLLDIVKKSSNTESEKPDVDKRVIDDIALSIHQSPSQKPEKQKWSCRICGHKFSRSGNMHKHMRKFHGPETVQLKRKPSTLERPFQCEQCSRNYVKKRHLKVHIRIKHSKENENNEKKKLTDSLTTDGIKPKLYEQPLCSICGKKFTTQTLLIVHMRRHTSEHPFKCDLCDRSYPRKKELTVHRRLHTGEKPFECKLCGEAFRVPGKLATHMLSHTDVRRKKRAG